MALESSIYFYLSTVWNIFYTLLSISLIFVLKHLNQHIVTIWHFYSSISICFPYVYFLYNYMFFELVIYFMKFNWIKLKIKARKCVYCLMLCDKCSLHKFHKFGRNVKNGIYAKFLSTVYRVTYYENTYFDTCTVIILHLFGFPH